MKQNHFQNYTTAQRKGFNLFDILKNSILSAHQLIEPTRSFGANDQNECFARYVQIHSILWLGDSLPFQSIQKCLGILYGHCIHHDMIGAGANMPLDEEEVLPGKLLLLHRKD